MADYDSLNQFLPRLQVYVRGADITRPATQPDGSVVWCALYKGILAIKITEKGNSQTMSLRFNGEWHNIVDNGDPKIGYIISPLLSEIKELSPFAEPVPKDGLIGCRSYKEIFDDLSEEILKLKKYSQAKELAKKLKWSHYMKMLTWLINGASKIDPKRTQGNKHTYGASHGHLYIQVIEEQGNPTILKWNDDNIVCQDPRLKEVADDVLKAFKARCRSMDEENERAFNNFIAAYLRASRDQQPPAKDQPVVNSQPAGERRIGERRISERRVGERRIIDLNNWTVIAENGNQL
ncbi:MAG: hypothetical protein LBB72_01905 [Spirochaetaceae bacterium]|jgi:hypothetical protein|nr:hypothetical protein [Spirochaetaceae bacterium]